MFKHCPFNKSLGIQIFICTYRTSSSAQVRRWVLLKPTMYGAYNRNLYIRVNVLSFCIIISIPMNGFSLRYKYASIHKPRLSIYTMPASRTPIASTIVVYGVLPKFSMLWANNADFCFAVYIFRFGIVILVSVHFPRTFNKVLGCKSSLHNANILINCGLSN